MLVVSHRGYCPTPQIPENSMASFKEALRLGVDGIETDLRLTADGQIVLFHDRMAANGKPVQALTKADLDKISGFNIPVLEDIFSIPNIFWNLELKTSAVLPALFRIFASRQYRSEDFLITSFHHSLVAECSQHLPVQFGLLFAERPLSLKPMAGLWRERCRNLHCLVFEFQVADENLIEEAKDLGLNTFLYGPMTEEEHHLCRKWAVDGIITDFPLKGRRTEGRKD